MKNLKFIVAVMGITVATFSSMTATAKGGTEPGRCIRTGQCGTTHAGQNIDGTWDNSGQQVTLELAP